jgi:hypothetical protein
VHGLKSKIQIPNFRDSLKGVDIFVAIETWTSEKDETEFDGYRYVSKLRKKDNQIGSSSSHVAVIQKEKYVSGFKYYIYWMILKA